MNTVILSLPGNRTAVASLYTAAQKLQSKRIELWELDGDSIAEAYLSALLQQHQQCHPDVILFPAGHLGNALASRLGSRLGLPVLTDVCSISDGQAGKAAYSANLTAYFALPHVFLASISTSAFDPTTISLPQPSCRIFSEKTDWTTLLRVLPTSSDRSELALANRIVVCGRGIGTRNNAAMFGALATQIGGILGGTRPVAIDEWVPSDRLIGISGTCVKPDVCLIFGASGAQAFAAGVVESVFLAGINNDNTAPLFRFCDVGVVEDCVAFAEALLKLFEQERSSHD